MLLVAIVDQRVEAVDGGDDHVAAAAAIAAVRPAELDELLAPERHAAVAAVARADIDLGLIKKFHDASDKAYASARQSAGLRRMARNSSLASRRDRHDSPSIATFGRNGPLGRACRHWLHAGRGVPVCAQQR